MTTGVAACMLIVLYVSDELSYDRFHTKIERMYRVNLNARLSGQEISTASTCSPMASTLVAEITGVEEATRFIPYDNQTAIKFGNISFIEEKVFAADSNFFDFFSFKLIEGDSKTALKEPNTIVMTETIARKYFGNESAIGKIVTIGNENTAHTVTGIVENPPSNSHITFNVLVSASSLNYLKNGIWLNNGLSTYFILAKNSSIENVHKLFPAMAEKYVGPEMEKMTGTTLKQMEQQGGAFGYASIKVADIHLHSTSQNEVEEGGNMMHVYFLMGIGLFIIVIACINFMNLSTARSAGRAKEVGLRKTLGSLRGQMITQFLAESFLYSFITVIFALITCYFVLPYFNQLAGKELSMNIFATPPFVMGMVALIIVVGLIAGSYPAFYLTAFNPVDVLKGKVRSGMKSKGVRSSLVVFQFALSIFLIIFTAVVYQQITFMEQRNLGLDKHNVLILNNASKLGNNMETFKNSLAAQPSILKTSYTNNVFPGVNSTTVFRAGGEDNDHIMGIYFADYDHQEVMRFEVKEGRYFSKDFPSDSTSILLNEAAVKEFGFTKPLQEEVIYNDDGKKVKFKVVGVIKDFNFESLRNKVRPLAIRLTNKSDNLMVRYEGSPEKALAIIEKLWKEQTANEPIHYTFLDQNFDRLFRLEQRMGQLLGVFSGLAIFIACLGLFALAAFTTEQRTKEIGIRKAMGATMPSLVLLLSKEFTVLVVFAFIPAAVAGWYTSYRWLEGFEYRIEISPLIFICSGLGAIIIAWLTVSYQSLKASLTNPVNSLRYE